ncbi:unnamed protein product, partial [Porites lobata]
VLDIISAIDRFTGSADPSVDFQPIVFKLDFLQRIAVGLDVDELVTELIGHAYRMLVEIDQRNLVNYAYQAPLNSGGQRGRPSYEISEEQLHFLLEQGFKVCDISKILGVSARTVERRMSTFGLSVSGMFSDIEDNQLDELVQIASSQHPGMGIRMLKGYLQSKGFRIQRERIRLSLLRTDPIGIVERWRSTTRRRHYNVRYPLSLWHIDGNHKLISLFYELFYTLENQDVLNADDDCHLWCLHYVFVPIINRHLSNWKDAWVHHPLRTERNRTPMQLWISGLQEAWGSLGPEGEVFQGDYSNYGIDWQGPVPEQCPDYVEVPDTNCPFTEEEMHLL